MPPISLHIVKLVDVGLCHATDFCLTPLHQVNVVMK